MPNTRAGTDLNSPTTMKVDINEDCVMWRFNDGADALISDKNIEDGDKVSTVRTVLVCLRQGTIYFLESIIVMVMEETPMVGIPIKEMQGKLGINRDNEVYDRCYARPIL